MKKAFKHLKGIAHGSYAMLHLRSHWCEHIGNTKMAFFVALLVNILAVPLSVFVSPSQGDPMQSLAPVDQLMLQGLMVPVVLITVLILTVMHRRHKKFPLVYAGVTYVGFVISMVLFGVDAIMGLYDHSLYAQNAPMLAHVLLAGALLWMVIVTSFIFKTALEISAAISLLMSSVLLFVLIAGQLLLQMALFSQ